MKGALASAAASVAVPLSFGLGLIIAWLASAIVRTFVVLRLGGFSLPWTQISKISISLFGAEFALLLLATALKVAVLGIPMAVSDLQSGHLSIERIFSIGFFHSARRTLLAVGISTAFVTIVFPILKPEEGQRYYQTIAAEIAVGSTAQSILLPNRVVEISRGVKVPELVRAMTDAVAIGHLALMVFLLAVCFRRLMLFLIKIDYVPTSWQRSRKWQIPRDGGMS